MIYVQFIILYEHHICPFYLEHAIVAILSMICISLMEFQAEVAMREDGKPGMSDEEVLQSFISIIHCFSL